MHTISTFEASAPRIVRGTDSLFDLNVSETPSSAGFAVDSPRHALEGGDAVTVHSEIGGASLEDFLLGIELGLGSGKTRKSRY